MSRKLHRIIHCIFCTIDRIDEKIKAPSRHLIYELSSSSSSLNSISVGMLYRTLKSTIIGHYHYILIPSLAMIAVRMTVPLPKSMTCMSKSYSI